MSLVIVVITLAFCVCANADIHDPMTYRAMFEEFKTEFDRTYPSVEVEERRFQYFSRNMKRASVSQLRNPHAVFGPTDLSDLSDSELKVRHNSEKHYARLESEPRRESEYAREFTAEELAARPSAIDWRKKGAVTYVKNQANCGSCWSFSATGNIEGQWFLAGHTLVALSEQELVSCDTDDLGCQGGLPSSGMDWLVQKKDGWITSEADYPYTSGADNKNGQCLLPKPNVAQIQGHHKLPHHEDQMATYLAAHGPVSIGVDAGNDWANYKSGVMTDCTAGTPDHGVLLVGYDTAASPPYWIIKNSWGPKWGDKGYLKVQYGTDQCHLTYGPVNALVNRSGPVPPPPPPTPSPPPVPTVAPPPAPTSPPKGNFTEWKCPTWQCKESACTASSRALNTCVSTVSGGSWKATCGSQLKIKIWHSNTDCSSIEDAEDLWPTNVCIEQSHGNFMEYFCPK